MAETRFEERLRAQLDRDAARVTTSPDAWSRIEARAAGARRRARRVALAAAGVATIAAIAVVAVVAGPAGVTIGPDPAGRTPLPSEAPTTVQPQPRPTASDQVPVLDWSTVRLDGSPAATLEGIASVGDTVVVVGEDGDGGAVSWLSRDGGETFERQPARAGGAWMAAAAVDGHIVVVGSDDGRPAIDVFDPASERWETAYRGDRLGTLYAVSDGPGGPIATGNLRAADGREGLLVGRGPEGWAPLDAPGMGGPETVLYHVAGGARGYVATGYGPDAGSIIDTWFSADGRRWTHLNAAPSEGIRAAEGVIDALVADPRDGRFWAVQAGGDVWASDDGRRWSVTASLTDGDGPLGFRAPAATPFDGGLLVVAGAERLAAFWSAGTEDPQELATVAAGSLTVGAGATLHGDAVLIPLSDQRGPLVWRGAPRP